MAQDSPLKSGEKVSFIVGKIPIGFHDFCFNTDQSYPLSVDVAKDSSFFFGKPKICLIIG